MSLQAIGAAVFAALFFLVPTGLAAAQFGGGNVAYLQAGPGLTTTSTTTGTTSTTTSTTSTTTTSTSTTSTTTSTTAPPAGTIAAASSLVEIQSASDYNQAEHEDVLRLYAAFFNRPPDAGGAKYWIGTIYEGRSATLDAIAAEFAISEEFLNTYGSVDNEQYLRILYQNVLGRQPDADGFDYWFGFLESGDLNRGSVVRWVAAGDEFENRAQFPDLTP